MSLKNGRKPISEKGTPVLNPMFGDRLYIPKEVKAAAKEAGYELKWLDAKRLAENQGYHPSGWEPVKKDEFGKVSNIQFGSAPDVERRGTVVLGKRKAELAAMYRSQIEKRNEANRRIVRTAKKELQESAAKLGIQTEIDGEYED